jgi:hypothetical protein
MVNFQINKSNFLNKKSTLLFIALLNVFSFQLLAQKAKAKNEALKSSLHRMKKN